MRITRVDGSIPHVTRALTIGTIVLTYTVTSAERPNNLVSPKKDRFGQAPAFPAAEGLAKDTAAGQHGRVLLVTTLDDDDPKAAAPIRGRLRKALDTSGPRIVACRVSGTMELKSQTGKSGQQV